MNCAWKPIAILVACTLLVPTHAGDQKRLPVEVKPDAAVDALRELMEKKGYVAIPLIQEGDNGCFIVKCKSGTETLRMLLDTGAEYSSLDIGMVKKLGLKKGEETEAIGIEGTRKGFETSLRGLIIGDFDTRRVAGIVNFAAFDFTHSNTVMDQRKIARIDGVLGRVD